MEDEKISLILGLFLGITVVQEDVDDGKTIKSDKTFKLVAQHLNLISAMAMGLDRYGIYFDNEAKKTS